MAPDGPNFSVHKDDISTACYLTDYLFTFTSFVLAKKLMSYHDKLPGIVTKKEGKNEAEGLLGQRQLMIKMAALFNAFLGASFFFGGIQHQFCYDATFPCHKYPWMIAQALGNPALPLISCIPLLTCLRLTTPEQLHRVKTAVAVIALVFSIEEAILEIITFGRVILLGNAVILLLCGFTTIFRSYRTVEYSTVKLFSGLFLQLGYVYFYLKILSICGVPHGFRDHGCPFPDWFNHNAVLHLVLISSFWLMSSAFIV